MKKVYVIFFFISFSSLQAQNTIFDIARNGTVEDISELYKKNNKIIDKINEAGYTTLILACYSGNTEVAVFLTDKVSDINRTSVNGTALMAAVVKGRTKIVKNLLKHNADPNITDSNKTTALHYAVMFKNIELITLLINSNADKNLKDNSGKSALDYAEIINDEKINTLLRNI